MLFRSTNNVNHNWIEGDFTSDNNEINGMNDESAITFDLWKAFNCHTHYNQFVRDIYRESLSSRIKYQLFYYQPDYYEDNDDIPVLNSYKFTIDYLNLCDDCETDLTMLTTILFSAFYEKNMNDSISSYVDIVDHTHVVRVKNVYYGDSLNYLLIRVGEMLDFSRDLFFQDIFCATPDYDSYITRGNFMSSRLGSNCNCSVIQRIKCRSCQLDCI